MSLKTNQKKENNNFFSYPININQNFENTKKKQLKLQVHNFCLSFEVNGLDYIGLK